MRLYRYWRKGDRSGFATLHIGDRREINCEIAFLTRSYGANVQSSDEGIKLHVGIGLVAIWLTIGGWAQRSDWELGFYFHDWALWLKIFSRWGEWRRDDPWWRTTHSIHPLDLIFGRMEYSVRAVVDVRAVEIPMPEGAYPGHVALKDEQWKRPRWPFARVIRRALVDVPAGVPHRSKWGEDATYGLTTPAKSVEEGIGELVASVLRDRWRWSHNHRDTGKWETA